MSKKLIYLVSVVLVLGMASTGLAQLEGYWPLDGDLLDASGNARHGSWMGDPNAVVDPNAFVDGAAGLGLTFNGTDEYVNIDGYKGIGAIDGVQQEFSVANWFKITASSGNHEMVTWGTGAGRTRSTWRVHEGRLRAEHGSGNLRGNTYVNDGEWHHGALVVVEGANLRVPNTRLYVDGVEDTIFSGSNNTYNLGVGADVSIGRRADNATRYWPGSLDEVYIFSRVLDADMVPQVMNGIVPSWPKADKPSPADGVMLEEVSTFLGWRAGQGAVSHDVYFGTTADLGADQLVSQQANNQYMADGLVPDQTYYWRIDETDADGIVTTGDVWSIWTPIKGAWAPQPADGQRILDLSTNISWSGGWSPIMHQTYFGTDADQVANAVGAPQVMDIGFDPGPLELDTTYYWRVDEFYGAETVKGPVWSFGTVPVLPVTDDPNLVALWTFDGDFGSVALDQSGNGNHVALKNGAQVIAGHGGDVLDLGVDGYGAISNLVYDVNNSALAEVTVSCWIRTDVETDQYIISLDRDENFRLEISGSGAGDGQVGWDVMTLQDGAQSQIDYGSVTRVDDGEWHHIAGMFDNGTATIYIDGFAEPSVTGGPVFGTGATDTRYGLIGANSEATSFDGSNSGGPPLAGEIDDLAIYNKAFTEDEMRQLHGNLAMAWQPQPAMGASGDIRTMSLLSWTPGLCIAEHDVYLGTDADAVAAADVSDTTGIYQGRQNLGNDSFSPALELDQTFYWRIDELYSDRTINKGRVWSFTVADSIIVDDFEGYTETAPDEIFATWIDGFGNEATNGALISTIETGIVHGGSQSMPFSYDNNMKYSEATMTLVDPRDWTEGGAGVLSLWYRGNPTSTGGFAEDPAGTYTMTASGADIWGQADEFHFAYKQLGFGPCTIIAKVESVDLTNNWAKAGVMIRDSLDAGSKFTAVYIMPTNDDGTATNGCSFQARLEADASAVNDSSVATDEQKAITAPYWVKLERGFAPLYNGYYSLDGVTWVPMSWNPQIIPTVGDDYVGLAVTSHDAALTCEAVFSNVEITGTVGAEWTSQDIGITSNALEPMYVSIANQTSPAVAVYNDDPNASTTDTWTEWVIDLQQFAVQGVDLTDVDRISIGFGDKDNVQAGGSGMVFFDDIRLYRPAEPEPEPAP